MIIVITCDKVIEKLHLRKMIRRMWGAASEGGGEDCSANLP